MNNEREDMTLEETSRTSQRCNSSIGPPSQLDCVKRLEANPTIQTNCLNCTQQCRRLSSSNQQESASSSSGEEAIKYTEAQPYKK